MTIGIEVPYNDDLEPLQRALAGVRRPGDFFVQGSFEAPMPRVVVRGAGILSFPVPSVQVEAVIAQGERAPYGRGRETVLDTSVRKVWQLAPSQIDIGGKSWPDSFERILSTVTEGLGCADANVSAELYKLLVYDEGDFFKAHRDSEKTEGMFGTLLIVLPSPHAGGELVLRHGGHEATVDLSGDDVAELRFAAFYADCEHEVLPVTRGRRVCLVYNLLQRPPGKDKKPPPLVAPAYDTETAEAADLLGKAFASAGAPTKIAWLLEHQYSPAGLSFSALKGADKALAKVFQQAAASAGCAIHLGIVHIEECGPAEYAFHKPRGRRHYHDELQEDANIEDFEVIEVSDGWSYIDNWLTREDSAAGFGKLPLHDGEVLPAGALDHEAPDEQRLLEASGNEGVSFERAYHRAALVLWPRSQHIDVLLQGKVQAALPYLEGRAAAARSNTEQQAALAEARRVVEAWERRSYSESEIISPVTDFDADPDDEELDWEDEDDWQDDWGAQADAEQTGSTSDRSRMIALLQRLADVELLERFIRGVVTARFDGNEADALAESAQVLGAERCGALFSQLIQRRMCAVPGDCINLFARVVSQHNQVLMLPAWSAALREIGAAVVEGLTSLRRDQDTQNWPGGDTRKGHVVDSDTLAALFGAFESLEAPQLRSAACAAIAANGKVFDPGAVIVPALRQLRDDGGTMIRNADHESLWIHIADTLLARSEYPPAPPLDWRQDVELSCSCADCRELRAFACDPVQQTHRFRVRKDRRQHLQRQIDRHRLDMRHVTERKGSPQSLVCMKTRDSHLRRCAEYRQDIADLAALAKLVDTSMGKCAAHCARIAAARERAADSKSS